MFAKILLAIVVLGVAFSVYVNSRPNSFRYERSGMINAPAEKIYPYLRDFKLGNEWSPYMKTDPNMKLTYSGAPTGTGSVLEFDGNHNVGSGRLEILREVPDELVELRMQMFKPVKGDNIIQYKLTPEGNGTRFTWTMSGGANFVSKLMGVLIDCERMVGDEFSKGIENLKNVVESKK